MELFYVGSRYYDPEIGRFINADTTDVLDGGNDHILENNLFAYCFNNPVNMFDDDGQWPKWITKAIAVVAVAAVVVAAVAITVSTFGAGSLAGVAMISASVTLAARATEVTVLQVKKGKSEGKSGSQIAKDYIESVYDNGGKIVGATTLTKSGSVIVNHIVNVQVAKIFGEKAALSTTLKTVGGKVIPYGFAAYAWGHTAYTVLVKTQFGELLKGGIS